MVKRYALQETHECARTNPNHQSTTTYVAGGLEVVVTTALKPTKVSHPCWYMGTIYLQSPANQGAGRTERGASERCGTRGKHGGKKWLPKVAVLKKKKKKLPERNNKGETL